MAHLFTRACILYFTPDRQESEWLPDSVEQIVNSHSLQRTFFSNTSESANEKTMKSLSEIVVLHLVLLSLSGGGWWGDGAGGASHTVVGFTWWGGGATSTSLSTSSLFRQQQQQQQRAASGPTRDHSERRRWAVVRRAAEAKNASEISHETVAEYRQKLSVIPRTNGDDREEVSLAGWPQDV